MNREKPQYDATAIILAGGACARMGRNKALLTITDKPLIQLIAGQLRTLCKEIIISTNAAAAYAFLNEKIIEDRIPFQGPFYGIIRAMQAAAYPVCLVTACDLPEISPELACRMLEAAGQYDCIVPVFGDFYEPLFAVYHKRILPLMQESLRAGNKRIVKIYPQCKTHFIPIAAPLKNLNNWDDYKNYMGA